MQKQFTPTPFAPIDRYILWFIILAAPLLFAGCECLLALGPGCSTTPFWQPSSGGSSLYCTYDHELREAQETEVGWVGVFETTKHCKKSRLSRTNYSTHYEGWTIAGFYDDEPASITGSSRDLFKNTDDKMCGSCEVRRHDKKRIKDLKIRVFEPYWMEVSAIVDGHAKLWNYYISRAEEVKVTDAFCPDILLYEHSRITECTDEKPNARSWWVPEEKLGDESIFFQDYINWAADRLNSPEMMLGLAMLALKWKSAPGDRSVEMTTEVSEILLEKLDCSKVFLRDRWYTEISPYSSLSRIWKHYLSSVEGLLSPPLQEQALKRCVDSIDAEVLRRIEEGRQFDVKAWSDRLEQEPLPSHEIVAVVDLYIIAGVPSSSGYYLWDHILSNYIQRRLTQPSPISPEIESLILTGPLAEYLTDESFVSEVFGRPKLRIYHDKLDEAWIKHLSQPKVWDSLIRAFKIRLDFIEKSPMNPENEEALERLLIEDLDRFDEETMVLLRTHDEDKRNSLLNRIDAQVAQNFPSGSALFNKRLSEENFPDPDDAVVREILERARSMKEKGHTFSYVDCLVVDLLLSNSTSGSCEIPDDF